MPAPLVGDAGVAAWTLRLAAFPGVAGRGVENMVKLLGLDRGKDTSLGKEGEKCPQCPQSQGMVDTCQNDLGLKSGPLRSASELALVQCGLALVYFFWA